MTIESWLYFLIVISAGLALALLVNFYLWWRVTFKILALQLQIGVLEAELKTYKSPR